MTLATTPVQPPRDGFLRVAVPLVPYRSITIRFQALCTSLFGVLFSFRSPYYFSIGLNLYLVLEVDVSQFHAGYPTHVTQVRVTLPLFYTYVTITLFGPTFQSSSVSSRAVLDSSFNTTFPCEGIRFELYRFHSPLLPASH